MGLRFASIAGICIALACPAASADTRLARDPAGAWQAAIPSASLASVPVAPLLLGGASGRSLLSPEPTAVYRDGAATLGTLDLFLGTGLSGGTGSSLEDAWPGPLQPIPPVGTHAGWMRSPPHFDKPTIRFHGEAGTLLPLGAGILGLAIGGRRPRPARA